MDAADSEPTAAAGATGCTDVRDRPVVNSAGSKSDTLFIQGLSRKVIDEAALLQALSAVDPPVEVDFSRVSLASRPSRIGGHVWAKYATMEIAERSKAKLHNLLYCGTYLSVQFELGINAAGERVVRKHNHITTPIRKIAAKNSNNKSTIVNKFDYSSRSVVVNNTEYPFPVGLYLTRVMALQHQHSRCAKSIAPCDDFHCASHLLDFVGSLSCRDGQGGLEKAGQYGVISSSRVAKELTEAMAMVDAVDRALKMLDLKRIYAPPGASSLEKNMPCETAPLSADDGKLDDSDGVLPTVRVFVLGDGVYPLCCALIALHYPFASWHYYSIDPLLEPLTFPAPDPATELNENSFRNRFHQHTEFSENFIIPSTEGVLSLVVSCHSHAPLQEFWDRLPRSPDSSGDFSGDSRCRSIAVTMPCCAQFGSLFDNSTKETVSEASDSVFKNGASSRGSGKRITKKQRKNMKKPIPTEPLLQFDDFEVYSPKRTVRIYAK